MNEQVGCSFVWDEPNWRLHYWWLDPHGLAGARQHSETAGLSGDKYPLLLPNTPSAVGKTLAAPTAPTVSEGPDVPLITAAAGERSRAPREPRMDDNGGPAYSFFLPFQAVGRAARIRYGGLSCDLPFFLPLGVRHARCPPTPTKAGLCQPWLAWNRLPAANMTS